MEWEEVVQIICDSVKEHDTRKLIYKRLLESVYFTEDDLESAFGIDNIFDDVAEEYLEEDEDSILDDQEFDD